MVDNVNSYQANVQTEGPQDFNDKQGFDIISGVELIFAKLQNNLAAENRDYARSFIDEIKAKQADQKELSDLVAALRSAIDGKTNYDDKVIIDADLADKINEWASSGKFFISSGEVIKASVDSCILSLRNIQEIIAADVHRDMCCVQDFLHKVSSYSQGAISAISKPGDTPAPVSGG